MFFFYIDYIICNHHQSFATLEIIFHRLYMRTILKNFRCIVSCHIILFLIIYIKVAYQYNYERVSVDI